jgi:mannose-6-phosphate isomerase-like protein (cupin superfamily)
MGRGGSRIQQQFVQIQVGVVGRRISQDSAELWFLVRGHTQVTLETRQADPSQEVD